MDHPRPSVLTALFWAYWDLCHVLRKAWRPALFAFLVLSFGSLAALVGPRLLTYDPAGQAVMRLAILVGLCFLLTPFFLAVHRFLLLGEEPTRYDFEPSRPRFQLFFGWLAVGVVLLSFPSTLAAFAEAKGPVNYFGQLPLDADFTCKGCAYCHVGESSRSFSYFFRSGCRCTRGRLANAFSDSRSRIWFVLAVTILPFIPVGLLAVAVIPLLRFSPGSFTGLVAGLLWLGATLLVASTLGAVIASRLYQVIGDRLNAPLR